MRLSGFGGQVAVFGLALAAMVPMGSGSAEASARSVAAHRGAGSSHVAAAHGGHGYGRVRYSGGGGGISCVPFARENTGIELAGNAREWWSNAEGVYERGARPEVGSVLNFRANGHMHMGHVAVVANVDNPRMVEIDHANWAGPGATRGGISRNITVVDVSPANDWTSVRVALGHTDTFGSVYPTYGFIYDRPDKGMMVANNAVAPAPLLNAAPRDLRPAAERIQLATAAEDSEEVAEASDDDRPRVRHAVARHGRGSGKAVVTRVKATVIQKTVGIERKAHHHRA